MHLKSGHRNIKPVQHLNQNHHCLIVIISVRRCPSQEIRSFRFEQSSSLLLPKTRERFTSASLRSTRNFYAIGALPFFRYTDFIVMSLGVIYPHRPVPSSSRVRQATSQPIFRSFVWVTHTFPMDSCCCSCTNSSCLRPRISTRFRGWQSAERRTPVNGSRLR